MQKEEIFALIDRLYIDQTKYNRFFEYLRDFTLEPRCKKGCLAFVDEVFNTENVSGKNQLAIGLLSSKTSSNSYDTRRFIENHPITIGYNNALKKARILILEDIGKYVFKVSHELSESNLTDKIERQVYLRRAVARLITVFHKTLVAELTTEQWPEVEPCEWIHYLTDSLEELVGKIDTDKEIMAWSDVYYDYKKLDIDKNLLSLKSYLNYLDTFLEF